VAGYEIRFYDNSLPSGGTFYYQIRSHNACGFSPYIATSVAVPVCSTLTANPQDISTPENTPVTITVTASGTGPFNYQIISNPTHGSFHYLSSSSVIYTPNTDYVGADSFQFRVFDPCGDVSYATINITVNP